MPRRSRAKRHVRIEAPCDKVAVAPLNEVLHDNRAATCCVHLSRRDVYQPWGFSMVGGLDQAKPLCVTKVVYGGPATNMLEEGEVITKIDDTPAHNIIHQHAVGLITNTGLHLKLTVQRDRMTSPAEATTVALPPTRQSRSRTILKKAPLPARRASSPIYEWQALPAEIPTYRPFQEIPLPAKTTTTNVKGVAGGVAIKGYAPVPFTLGVNSRMTSARGRSHSEHRPVRNLAMFSAAPLSAYYTTPFYTTPDVAMAGYPAAALRSVEENLPHGLTPSRSTAPAVHPFRSLIKSNYPFMAPPRINRARKDEGGPCIMMHI